MPIFTSADTAGLATPKLNIATSTSDALTTVRRDRVALLTQMLILFPPRFLFAVRSRVRSKSEQARGRPPHDHLSIRLSWQPALQAGERRSVIDPFIDSHERPIGAPNTTIQRIGVDRCRKERVHIAIRIALTRTPERTGQLHHVVAGASQFEQRSEARLAQSMRYL